MGILTLFQLRNARPIIYSFPVVAVFVSVVLWPLGAVADQDDIEPHVEAVTKLVIQRDIDISYDYVATLMRLPNAFGEGAACIICHGSSDPKRSYRGLDLTSCSGFLRGSTEPPVRPIIVPGQPEESRLVRHLRNNRMPYGVAFDHPTGTKNILAIKNWIDSGAKNDNHFNRNILSLFSQREAFGIDQTCTFCHMSNDRESVKELDLSSYRGIMLGALVITRARRKLPPVKIVEPGNSAKSALYQRLIENRMPAGIDPTEKRDHPNTLLLRRWIKQGAKCN